MQINTVDIKRKLLRYIDNFPTLKGIAYSLLGKAHPIFLDYLPQGRPRYEYGIQPHALLNERINKYRSVFQSHLEAFLQYYDNFVQIPKIAKPKSTLPRWENGWLSSLDAIALYSFLCINRPRYYFEIGSGNSTKFARQAINDHGLRTKIISLDPCPRVEIDDICDDIIRCPLEEADINIFKKLNEGDILFIDSSHRIFMNSDVTVIFLDIIPAMNKDVYVHFHDIYLPFDYPSQYQYKYFSEQYLLAAYLLRNDDVFEIVLANEFISQDEELLKVMAPLFQDPRLDKVQQHGVSFWVKIG